MEITVTHVISFGVLLGSIALFLAFVISTFIEEHKLRKNCKKLIEIYNTTENEEIKRDIERFFKTMDRGDR